MLTSNHTTKGIIGLSTKFNYQSVKNKLKQTSVDREKIWINFFIGLAFFSILAGLIIFFLFLLKTSNATNAIDIGKTGQIGDFVGGIVGSIWSLTGVLLFYATLRLQRRELKQNRVFFELSRLTEVVYHEIDIFNKQLDNLKLKDVERDSEGRHKKYQGRESIILLTKRVEIIKEIQRQAEINDSEETTHAFTSEDFTFIDINKSEFFNIYDELNNHVDTITAVLIKEDIPPIDLNELKAIFFRNVGREFLNSSEHLLLFIDYYIEYKKKTDASFKEVGSIESAIKRKIKSIKKFRNKYYDKKTIEQYLARREMYNIHYF